MEKGKEIREKGGREEKGTRRREGNGWGKDGGKRRGMKRVGWRGGVREEGKRKGSGEERGKRIWSHGKGRGTWQLEVEGGGGAWGGALCVAGLERKVLNKWMTV